MVHDEPVSAVPGNTTDPCACPAGFTRCAGRCYRRLPAEALYSDSEVQCAELGAHLAVPRSEPENQCARQLMVGDDVWLGVTDEETEGQWMGKDGCGRVQPPSSWWMSGEPSGETNSDCIYIHNSGYWADWECPTLSYPLCQLSLCHKQRCM